MEIVAENLYKRYAINAKYWVRYRTMDFFSQLAGSYGGRNLRSKEFWAVKNVSLSLKPGDRLGLIGRNGSGKTTLLRMLAGTIRPDNGSILTSGNVDYLSPSGYHFRPKLTGVENIWVAGTVMGMTAREIKSKIDSIAQFSELEEHLDMPVSCYSSGMTARLGFAIAAHLDPQILMVDETLGVGDHVFRRKSIERMKALSEKSIFVFASHSMDQIRQFANKAICIDQGGIVASGNPDDVCRYYMRNLNKAEQPVFSGVYSRLNSITIQGVSPEKLKNVDNNSDVRIRLELELDDCLRSSVIRADFGSPVFKKMYYSCEYPVPDRSNNLTLNLKIHAGEIKSGFYAMRIRFSDKNTGNNLDVIPVFPRIRFGSKADKAERSEMKSEWVQEC